MRISSDSAARRLDATSSTSPTLVAPLLRAAADLGPVASRYIGETEKNIDAPFGDAPALGAALSFDEADALFDRSTAAPGATGEHQTALDAGDLHRRAIRYLRA